MRLAVADPCGFASSRDKRQAVSGEEDISGAGGGVAIEKARVYHRTHGETYAQMYGETLRCVQ